MTNWDWDIIGDYAIPVLTGIASYFVGRKKRKNDFLAEMQRSIDLLSAKNAELIEDVVKLRTKNVELLAKQDDFRLLLDDLKLENKLLKTKVDNLTKKLNAIKRR